jgi:amidase
MTSAVHYLELIELSRRIHAREISPVEATAAQLTRIDELDGQLKSYAHMMAEAALMHARAAETEIMRGETRGPLHGVPIAVKDLCWTQGVPTAAGMTIYKDYRPTEDATVVRKLYAAGAIILGKLQLTEGAYADHHPQILPPVNPWNAAHWPGASSSGSGVATAAGLCYGSLGSDTGGSIRFPSAANGVTGLKPTWGRVSRHGVFELAATLDHIGPMARSAADCGAILGVIAGSDPNDPTAVLDPVPNYLAGMTRGLHGLRIGGSGRQGGIGNVPGPHRRPRAPHPRRGRRDRATRPGIERYNGGTDRGRRVSRCPATPMGRAGTGPCDFLRGYGADRLRLRIHRLGGERRRDPSLADRAVCE